MLKNKVHPNSRKRRKQGGKTSLHGNQKTWREEQDETFQKGQELAPETAVGSGGQARHGKEE